MAQRGTPIPNFVIARLLHLRRQGVSLRRIAAACDISKSTVCRYLARRRADRLAA